MKRLRGHLAYRLNRAKGKMETIKKVTSKVMVWDEEEEEEVRVDGKGLMEKFPGQTLEDILLNNKWKDLNGFYYFIW